LPGGPRTHWKTPPFTAHVDSGHSALGRRVSRVRRLITSVRERGVGVVFITHNARHAMKVGDQFAVLIHGRLAARFARGEKSREEVLNLMAGGEESGNDLAAFDEDFCSGAPISVLSECRTDARVRIECRAAGQMMA
jgi:ABC-type sugar transport system ATPase subunit